MYFFLSELFYFDWAVHMMNKKKLSKNLIFTFGAYALLLVLNIVVSKVVLISYGSEVNGLLASVNQVYSYIANQTLLA